MREHPFFDPGSAFRRLADAMDDRAVLWNFVASHNAAASRSTAVVRLAADSKQLQSYVFDAAGQRLEQAVILVNGNPNVAQADVTGGELTLTVGNLPADTEEARVLIVPKSILSQLECSAPAPASGGEVADRVRRLISDPVVRDTTVAVYLSSIPNLVQPQIHTLKSLEEPDEDHKFLTFRGQVPTNSIALGEENLVVVALKRKSQAARGAVSPDGQWAVITGDDGGIRMAGRHVRLDWPADRGQPTVLDISRDSQRLLAATSDGTLLVWDLSNLKQDTEPSLFDLSRRCLHAAAFLPCGRRVVAAGEDRVLHAVNLETGVRGRLTAPGAYVSHFKPILSLAVVKSSKEAWIATAGADRCIAIWDADSGVQRRRWDVESDAVTALAFAPGGERLVSADSGGQICIWDLTAEIPAVVTKEVMAGTVADLRVTPDGRKLITAGFDGSLRVRDLSNLGKVKELSDGGRRRWFNIGGSGDRLHVVDNAATLSKLLL